MRAHSYLRGKLTASFLDDGKPFPYLPMTETQEGGVKESEDEEDEQRSGHGAPSDAVS